MSNSKFSLVMLLIPIITLTTRSAFAENATANFKDIKAENDYYVAINYLKENSIINGYEDNTFKPSQKINRAEALKMISAAAGLDSNDPENPTEKPFTDTPLEAWYSKYLSKAKEKGIIEGYKDGSFHPEKNINLAETLKMYFEAIAKTTAEFDYISTQDVLFIDTAQDAWYSKYTSYAGAKNIINIYNDNNINPEQSMTRGYLAEIIYRTLKHAEGFDFGKATFYFGIKGKAGDNYDLNMMTTAHKTLPFGTIVEVTNLANSKSVKVKVTDRGPYVPGRVLDLSKIAFSELASPGKGIIKIQYKIVE